MNKYLLSLLCIFAFCQTQAQFTENFEGGVFPPGWIVADNGVGPVHSWTLLTQNSNTHAFINREFIGIGNTSEDWLVTPGIELTGSNTLSFWSWQDISGDQGALYQVRVSTTSQSDQSTFVTIDGWTETDLIADVFNWADQKIISLEAYAGQVVYIAFVRVYFSPFDSINGDRWHLDEVSVTGNVQPFNNISGHVYYSEATDCSTPLPISFSPVQFTGVNTTSAYTLQNGSYSMNCNNLDVPITVSAAIDHSGFEINPESYSYNFSDLGHVETADFCMTPIGIHPDLGISFIYYFPGLVPGVTTPYGFILTNHGNQAHSGTVNISFDGSKFQFTDATENPSAENPGVLSWSFTDLLPFNQMAVDFGLRLNSSTDSPPVNINDLFTFTASIDMADADQDLSNNTETHEWVAKMPFDPNNKQVMEGEVIDIGHVGDYLHYVVNFQNLGTGPAIDVKITDKIDSDLDLASLRVLGGSHPFTTSVANGTIEFRFENINLPAAVDDQPGSHGHVAFKIKPANSVGIGSEMSNKANIYFDYNYPIITNTVTTTVAALGLGDFDLAKQIGFYPNPASNQISFRIDDGVFVDAISICNMLGQVVRRFSTDFDGGVLTSDISELQAGHYLVRIATNKGIATRRLIKL